MLKRPSEATLATLGVLRRVLPRAGYLLTGRPVASVPAQTINSQVQEVLSAGRRPRSPLIKMKISPDQATGEVSFLAYDTSEVIDVPQFNRTLSSYLRNRGFTKKLRPTVIAVSEREGIGGPIETYNLTTGEVEKTLHINSRILAVWMAFFEAIEESEDQDSISWTSFISHLRAKDIMIFNEGWLRFALARHPDIFIWKEEVCQVQRGADNKETVAIAIRRCGEEYVQDLLRDALDGEIDFDIKPALPISEIMKVTGLEELTIRYILRKDKDFIVVGDGTYSFTGLYPRRFAAYKAPVKNPSSRPSKAWKGVYFVLKQVKKPLTKKEVHQEMLRLGVYWIYSAVANLLDTPPYPNIIIMKRRPIKRGEKGIPYFSLNMKVVGKLKKTRKK